MAINSGDQNKNIIEKILFNEIKKMCIRLKLGLADWDIDDTLRGALQEPTRLKQIQDIVKKYDETFDLAIKSKTKLQDKYKILYKLNK